MWPAGESYTAASSSSLDQCSPSTVHYQILPTALDSAPSLIGGSLQIQLIHVLFTVPAASQGQQHPVTGNLPVLWGSQNHGVLWLVSGASIMMTDMSLFTLHCNHRHARVYPFPISPATSCDIHTKVTTPTCSSSPADDAIIACYMDSIYSQLHLL